MQSNRSSPAIIKIIIAIGGLIIAWWGALISLLIMAGMLFSPAQASLDSAIVSISFLVLGVGLGGALAWQAGRALLQRPSAPFGLPPIWFLLLIFAPALIIGQLLITFDFLALVTFPPFHVIAALIPGLALLAFAAQRLKAVKLSWREIIIHLSGGAFLSTLLAFILEIVIGIGVLIAVFAITALFPGGIARLEDMAANLQDPTWLENPNNLSGLLLSPPVAITIVLVFVVLAPIFEELAKLLGIVLMSYRRPSLPRLFLWGLASGAGFGLVENLLNTVTGLDIWALVILMRVGATLMHCLNSGLMALGWHYMLAERRPQKFLGLYVMTILIHAAWNGAVIGMAGTALVVADSSITAIETIGGWLVLLFLTLLIILFAAMIIAFALITSRLRGHLFSHKLVESTAKLMQPTI